MLPALPHNGWIKKPGLIPPSSTGEYIQHNDNQLAESGWVERHAVLGDLLYFFRLRCSLRICHHLATDENQDFSKAHHTDAKRRNVQDGRGSTHRVPHHFSHLQCRLLGSVPLLEQALFLCALFLYKMENVHLFLKLTPTLRQMPRDVTNISTDWADFCQCA